MGAQEPRRPAADGAPGIDPDVSRVSLDPNGGPPSTTMKSSGELDTSFAGDGTTWSYLPGYNGGRVAHDEAEAVAVDAAGGIIVGAHGLNGKAFAIVRHNADGTLDTTFGSNGLATPFADLSGQLRAMAIQPDGRIVVAGYAGGSFALARLMADGSLDESFGSGGQVLTDVSPLSPFPEFAHDMALQADGRIVLAGRALPWGARAHVDTEPDRGDVATLARYNADGSLDKSFGSGGVVFDDVYGDANAVAVQPDGRIVVAGSSFKMTRFNADGTVDTGFGPGGHVALPFGDEGWKSEANAILVQPDGKVVVAGGTFGSQYDFAIARLDPDGSPDKGFGHDGMVTTDFNGGLDLITALVLQPDGGLVAAGYAPSHHSSIRHFALARYKPTGALDRSFGKSGLATAAIDDLPTAAIDVVSYYYDLARALAVQPDGRLVAAGYGRFSCEGGACDGYALARFLP